MCFERQRRRCWQPRTATATRKNYGTILELFLRCIDYPNVLVAVIVLVVVLMVNPIFFVATVILAKHCVVVAVVLVRSTAVLLG